MLLILSWIKKETSDFVDMSTGELGLSFLFITWETVPFLETLNIVAVKRIRNLLLGLHLMLRKR